jgi:quercetin dioxygenase-like cupin family protein
MTKYPPIRRVVTGHNKTGDATVVSDKEFQPKLVASGDAEFALLWTAPDLPVDNNDDTDGAERDAGLTLKGGSVIRVVDMLPGRSSPMHRTNSLDYGIVVKGELELILDNDETVQLKEGDLVVQRGTIHMWRNPNPDTVCRIVFILTEATAVEVDGKALTEIHP